MKSDEMFQEIRNLIIRVCGCNPDEDDVEKIVHGVMHGESRMDLQIPIGLGKTTSVVICREEGNVVVKGRLDSVKCQLTEEQTKGCARINLMYGEPPNGIDRVMKAFGK